MRSFTYYLHNPNKIILGLLNRYGGCLPDVLFLKIKFRLLMGYRLDIKNPQTFCEKLQWLKLYNRNPEYTIMVDKVKAKEYVASIIGEEFIIPTLGVWNNPDEIDFDALPEKFVIKCNHNSGLGMYICKDKNEMDVVKVKKLLRKGLRQNYYLGNREWPYKNVPRRIIAEKYIDPASNIKDLPDYKWYCFNGEPKYCQLIQNRTSNETIDFYDTEWHRQEFIGLNPVAKHANSVAARPLNLEEQIQIARKLSKDIPFSRIDLYETGAQTYFGEITFFPMSGMGEFNPSQYNEVLGEMLTLPGKKRGGGDYQCVARK